MQPDSPLENTHFIEFFYEDVNFDFEDTLKVMDWVINSFIQENKKVECINYIFCSDAYLHKLNVQYLDHDTLTDVITFPNSRIGEPIEGDIFISIDRVVENAKSFNVLFNSELLRVMIHGSLHLMGYKDKAPEDQKLMRQKEDFYLTQYTNL